MTTITRPSSGSAYAPTAEADRRALLAEGLACITSGRPLPEALRPAPTTVPAPASCSEGIARILGGPV